MLVYLCDTRNMVAGGSLSNDDDDAEATMTRRKKKWNYILSAKFVTIEIYSVSQ